MRLIYYIGWLKHKGDKSDNDQSDDIKSAEDHGKEEAVAHSISFKLFRDAHKNSLHHHKQQAYHFLFNFLTRTFGDQLNFGASKTN